MRLLAEIRAAGYTGGCSQLKALVQQLRPALTPAPVVRFETPGGKQAQVDRRGGPRRRRFGTDVRNTRTPN